MPSSKMSKQTKLRVGWKHTCFDYTQFKNTTTKEDAIRHVLRLRLFYKTGFGIDIANTDRIELFAEVFGVYLAFSVGYGW